MYDWADRSKLLGVLSPFRKKQENRKSGWISVRKSAYFKQVGERKVEADYFDMAFCMRLARPIWMWKRGEKKETKIENLASSKKSPRCYAIHFLTKLLVKSHE
jgi:hypothetical protein